MMFANLLKVQNRLVQNSSFKVHSKFDAETRCNNNDVCKFVQSPKSTCSKFKFQSSKFDTLNQ